jgi:hypothetical protein
VQLDADDPRERAKRAGDLSVRGALARQFYFDLLIA